MGIFMNLDDYKAIIASAYAKVTANRVDEELKVAKPIYGKLFDAVANVLNESKNATSVGAHENTAIATAGEHLTIAHILKHASQKHKEAGNLEHATYLHNKGTAHQTEAQKLLHGKNPQLVVDAIERSRHVSKKFIEHHESNGNKFENLHDIHHTAKSGDVTRITGQETNQTDDPSDLIAHFKKGTKDSFHGLSYKHNKSNTLGTPGTDSVDKSLGTQHKERHSKFQEMMKKKYGDKYSSKESRKALQKSSQEARDDARKFAEDSAQHTSHHFNKAEVEKQRAHMKSFFKMNPKVPYVLAKGFGTGGSYGAQLHKHDDNEKGHAINNATKFSAEHKGSNVHYYAHTSDGKKHHLGYSEHRFTHGGFTSFGLPSHSK